MKTGRNIERMSRSIPVSGGAHSDPELSGIDAEPDRTILKISGLKFPAPDPEVEEKPTRRRFTAAYKLRILREADQCQKRGELGALLRREGLYHSNLQTWRRARERGERAALSEKKRGRKLKPRNPLAKENLELKRENKRLKAELRKAGIIIDVQKKISDLLGIDQPPTGLEEID